MIGRRSNLKTEWREMEREREGGNTYESNNVRKLSLIRANWQGWVIRTKIPGNDVEISECETNGTNDPGELSHYMHDIYIYYT